MKNAWPMIVAAAVLASAIGWLTYRSLSQSNQSVATAPLDPDVEFPPAEFTPSERSPSKAGKRPKSKSAATGGAASGVDQGAISESSGLPKGLTRDEYDQAEKQFKLQFPDRKCETHDVLMLAADQAAADKKYDKAIACYRAIDTSVPGHGLVARLQEGMLLIERDRAGEAEVAFLTYLEAARVAERLNPQDVTTAFKWLNYILSIEIRLEERKEYLKELHAIGLADPLDSKQLYFPNLLILNSPLGRKRVEQFVKADPKNVRLLVAQARYKTLEGQFEAAIKALEVLHVEFPADKGISAALLEAYFENSQLDKLEELARALPVFDETEPWLLIRMRGEAALQAKDFVAAATHFEAALARDATYAACQMGLARAYAGLGKTEEHEAALKRSAILADIRVNLTKVQTDTAGAAQELADKCRELNREDAANAFTAHAKSIASSAPAK